MLGGLIDQLWSWRSKVPAHGRLLCEFALVVVVVAVSVSYVAGSVGGLKVLSTLVNVCGFASLI